MMAGNSSYPSQSIEVLEFPEDFGTLLSQPAGLVDWPPDQVTYLGLYLKKLGCKSVVRESHYIDRDFILDHSVFYSRSLRNYANHCSRLHFFACPLTPKQWDGLFGPVADAERQTIAAELGRDYLGFIVIKPLLGTPIGRTVLRTYPALTDAGSVRVFGGTRKYEVHLAGYTFTVDGLAFQQQDRGVSACATTALWSSLQKVAHDEKLFVPTPAHITEAASRYLLSDGRSLPSEGLNIQQICEAIRGSGLQPQVVRSISPEEDRAQLAAYIGSGLPPVLAIQPISGGQGHAVCAVGMKTGDLKTLVPPPEHPHHIRAANALQGLYVHDDRLGPYANADLFSWTYTEGGQNRIATALQIHWPDRTQAELSILKALIVPVPDKIRMSITRILVLGTEFAQVAGMYFKEFEARAILNVGYKRGVIYRESAFSFGLSEPGLRRLCCEAVFPRFLGVIEVSAREGPLFDVLLDTTETIFSPSVLMIVKRGALPSTYESSLQLLADHYGAQLIV